MPRGVDVPHDVHCELDSQAYAERDGDAEGRSARLYGFSKETRHEQIV
jgi:hypothetical protein